MASPSTTSPNQHLLAPLPPHIRSLPTGLTRSYEEFAFAHCQAETLQDILLEALKAMERKINETRNVWCCTRLFQAGHWRCGLRPHLPTKIMWRVWYFYFEIGDKELAVEKAEGVVLARFLEMVQYAAQAATGRYLPVEIVTLIGEMAKDEENVILEDRILPLAMDSVPNTDSEGSESEESEDEDSDAEDSASEESEDSDSDSEHSNAEATDGENSENDPFDDEEDDTVIQDTDIALDADGYQDPRFVDSGWGAECLC